MNPQAWCYSIYDIEKKQTKPSLVLEGKGVISVEKAVMGRRGIEAASRSFQFPEASSLPYSVGLTQAVATNRHSLAEASPSCKATISALLSAYAGLQRQEEVDEQKKLNTTKGKLLAWMTVLRGCKIGSIETRGLTAI